MDTLIKYGYWEGEEKETTRYLFQSLGLLLTRGNEALILVVAEVDGDQDFDAYTAEHSVNPYSSNRIILLII